VHLREVELDPLLVTGFAERPHSPKQEHVQGPDLHLQELGALVTAPIFEQAQAQDPGVAWIDALEHTIDALAQRLALDNLFDGRGRLPIAEHVEVVREGAAQALAPTRSAKQIPSLVLGQGLEPGIDARAPPLVAGQGPVGRDEGLAHTVVGIVLVTQHRHQHVAEQHRCVVTIEALERPLVALHGTLDDRAFVRQGLRATHRRTIPYYRRAVPRLDQLLARNLEISRSQATRLLRSGAVREPGKDPGKDLLKDPKLRLGSDALPLEVEVRGAAWTLREVVHLIQHKPVGVVTSRKDGRHTTAWELLDGAPLQQELRAVGRLDLDAAGLLFWTTEGPRIHALTHPKRAVPRTYQVALARPFTPPPRDADGEIALTVPPLEDDDRPLHPRIVSLCALDEADRHPALEPPEETQCLAQVVLLDGAHHEVKRIFAALDSHVLRLARVSHGGMALPRDLPAGQWRLLDDLPDPPRPAKPAKPAKPAASAGSPKPADPGSGPGPTNPDTNTGPR